MIGLIKEESNKRRKGALFWKKEKETQFEKRVIKILEDSLQVQREIAESLKRYSVIFVAHGVKVVFITKGDNLKMADLTMKLGDTKTAVLHYVDADGNDLGPVPASDSPSFSVNDPASISMAGNSDGSTVLTDTHNGDSDVTVTFVGSVKGFSDTKSILCQGVVPPPPVPAGVKVVFQ